jgi:hypothetical protein
LSLGLQVSVIGGLSRFLLNLALDLMKVAFHPILCAGSHLFSPLLFGEHAAGRKASGRIPVATVGGRPAVPSKMSEGDNKVFELPYVSLLMAAIGRTTITTRRIGARNPSSMLPIAHDTIVHG